MPLTRKSIFLRLLFPGFSTISPNLINTIGKTKTTSFFSPFNPFVLLHLLHSYFQLIQKEHHNLVPIPISHLEPLTQHSKSPQKHHHHVFITYLSTGPLSTPKPHPIQHEQAPRRLWRHRPAGRIPHQHRPRRPQPEQAVQDPRRHP